MQRISPKYTEGTLEDIYANPKRIQKSIRADGYKGECFSLWLSEACISLGKGKILSI